MGGTAAANASGPAHTGAASRPAVNAAARVQAARQAPGAPARPPGGGGGGGGEAAPCCAPPRAFCAYRPAATSTQTRWWSLPSAMAAEASLEAGQNTPLSR